MYFISHTAFILKKHWLYTILHLTYCFHFQQQTGWYIILHFTYCLHSQQQTGWYTILNFTACLIELQAFVSLKQQFHTNVF